METQHGDDEKEPLPQDLMIEILTKLPAKSLFKFRCVSKQWRSIIRSRSFMASFMSLSLSRPHVLLGYYIRRRDERRLLFSSLPLYPKDSNHSSLVTKHDMHHDESTILYDCDPLVFCNSVRGIICVLLGDRFVLCNPTTRQVIRLPDDPITESDTCFMFLGYDQSNDQYKILCGSRNRDDGSFEHSVCTLRLGEESSFSSWRRVESGKCSFFYCTNALCINGVVYYGAWDNPPNSNFVIVSFDVGSERLVLMEPPKQEGLVLPLVNYQGKLACLDITRGNNSYSLRILDDIKKQIWSTKTGVFPPSFRDSCRDLVLVPHSATDGWEIIFVSNVIDGVLEVFYYDLKKNNVSKRVKIGGSTESSNEITQISISCDHVENIISF